MADGGKKALTVLGVKAAAAVVGGLVAGPAGAVGAAGIVLSGCTPGNTPEQRQAKKDTYQMGKDYIKKGYQEKHQ